MQGFKQFILRGNVVDLAVGIVIGAAFNNVITSFVGSFFTPIISALTAKADFSKLALQVNGVAITYGQFLNALISFLLVATVVYFFVVLPMNKLQNAVNSSKKPADPTTKKCPFCFSDIPLPATRCPNCTSQLEKK